MQEIVIALDIGGTSVKHGAVTQLRQVTDDPFRTELDTSADAETLLTTFSTIISSYIIRQDIEVKGLGLGFPGPFDYDKGECYISGFGKYESLYGMDIRAELGKRVILGGMPVRFRNDAEAAIVGETRYGTGAAYSRVIGVTLGHGFGSAFLKEGIPQSDSKDLPENGWLFRELWQGQVAEDHFSIKGIQIRLNDLGYTADDAKSAAENARAGDQVLVNLYRDWGGEMGTFLQPYVDRFQAEALLVMGGLTAFYDLFGPYLRSALNIVVHKGQRINDAALLGAADLIWQGN